MATKEEKLTEAIQQLMDSGFSVDDIKEMGLTEKELLAMRSYNEKKVVTIEIELDDDARLTEEEFNEMLEEGRRAIKGQKTLKEGFMILATAANMFIKYKTLGVAGG